MLVYIENGIVYDRKKQKMIYKPDIDTWFSKDGRQGYAPGYGAFERVYPLMVPTHLARKPVFGEEVLSDATGKAKYSAVDDQGFEYNPSPVQVVKSPSDWYVTELPNALLANYTEENGDFKSEIVYDNLIAPQDIASPIKETEEQRKMRQLRQENDFLWMAAFETWDV